tara:strand:+ start:14129 stop:14755 length:627 start_codon:yes stop_codon:yes gene_type:complete
VACHRRQHIHKRAKVIRKQVRVGQILPNERLGPFVENLGLPGQIDDRIWPGYRRAHRQNVMTSMDTQTVVDQQQIRELQNFYSYSIDSGEYDNLDRVFMPDAVADFGPAGPTQGLTGIKQTIQDALHALTVAQHVNGNHWSKVQGDTAVGGCYFRVHMVREHTPGGDHFEMGGRYEDDLVKTQHGWRFARRRVTVLWSTGNPDVRFGQ